MVGYALYITPEEGLLLDGVNEGSLLGKDITAVSYNGYVTLLPAAKRGSLWRAFGILRGTLAYWPKSLPCVALDSLQ